MSSALHNPVVHWGSTTNGTPILSTAWCLFLAGKSAPDFAAEDYEVNFKGRATLDDSTPEGRRQMML